MNIKEVKDLIHEVLESDICEFELEHTGTKMKLRRGLGPDQEGLHQVSVDHAARGTTAAQTTESKPPLEGLHGIAGDDDLHIISSPIVGTFYRAPSPGVDSYVKVGDFIEEGMVLCIVEAMKLMNEIPSDTSGEIVRIYVENGNPVEFGQKLFGIRPRK